MSLSSWLRNGNANDQRLLLALQDSADVARLYAQWREDRLADYTPAPVVPITVAKGYRHHFKNAAESVAPDPAA